MSGYTNSTGADTFHIEDTEVTLLSDSGTRIVTAHIRANMLPLHTHPHHELFFVEYGTLRVLFQDSELLLEPNDLLVIPPKVEHLTLRTGENSSRYNFKFHINKNALNLNHSLFRELSTTFSYPYLLLRNYPMFKEIFRNLHQCMLSQNKLYEGYYFHEFVVRLLSLAPALANQIPQKTIHIENNIMRYHTVSNIINGEFNYNITLEYIAKTLNLSVRQTNRVIQECYGVPFSELILENKMRYAANLLANSSLSIAEVSRKTGYASVKGFYHSFKKRFHMLPSEYRKQHGEEGKLKTAKD